MPDEEKPFWNALEKGASAVAEGASGIAASARAATGSGSASSDTAPAPAPSSISPAILLGGAALLVLVMMKGKK